MEVVQVSANFISCEKIWTGVKGAEEADSMLYSDDGIIAVGTKRDLEGHPLYADARKTCVKGMMVPALSDCHIHLLAYAKQKLFADVFNVKNKAEMLEVIKKSASQAKPDEWVCAYNMNEVRWGDTMMPDKRDLDSLGIPNPVLVQRNCTHATVLNSRAMSLCGLADDKSREGVLRYESGEPSGIIVEDVQAVAHTKMASDTFTREKLLSLLSDALDECSSYGFSVLFACGADSLGMEEPMDLYQELRERGELKLRIFSQHDTDSNPRMTTGFGDRWINYQGYKIFMDGSLGARTAALSQPYADAPSELGMLLHKTEDLVKLLKKLDEIKCQSLVHAIGDGALDQLLDALEAARSGDSPEAAASRLPLLVNHCMISRPDQRERMRRLGCAATIQPSYVESDRKMAPQRLGDRIDKRWAYAWKSLINAGITLNGSSDCPIEPLNPWRGICYAVERNSGEDIWMPDEKLTVEEALSMYTVNPAVTSGAMGWRGTIEPGKEADFAVIDRDIFACPEGEIKDVKVRLTVVGGRTMYKRTEA